MRTRAATCVAFLSLCAVFGATNAYAATTVSPSGPGAVGADQLVRDDSVSLAVSHDGTWPDSPLIFRRAFTTAAPYPSPTAVYNPPTQYAFQQNAFLRGLQDLSWLGVVGTCSGDAKTPLTRVSVTSPTASTDRLYSAPRSVSNGDVIAGTYPRSSTNPAFDPVANTSTFRGEVPKNIGTGGVVRGANFTYNLAGKPAGVYTVSTEARDAYRTDPGIGSSRPASCVAGDYRPLQSQTFEYRPWKYTFKDLLGNGSVSLNVDPVQESAWTVGPTHSQIREGHMAFFTVPDGHTVPLPTDPQSCADDPSACVPDDATLCEPSAGCDPRLIVVSHLGPEGMTGLFDTKTGAFIAIASTDNFRGRVLFSLGKDLDAVYRATLNKIEEAAAKFGIDLAEILATKVRVRSSGPNGGELTLSLLNGLQLDPRSGHNGIQIITGPTVQAGLILDIYSRLEAAGGTGCDQTLGDSDPTTAAPDRTTATADVGYTVKRSDLLPAVPRVGPLGALVGGPVYNITGDFVGGTGELVNTAVAVIGVDTAADEPNGFPLWIEPFLSGTHVANPKSMDFLGTAMWTASETPVGATGCLTVDFMLGAGVALFDNPLPIGFGNVPVWDENPHAAGLMAKIDAAVQKVVDDVTSNPTVDSLLNKIVGSLPTDL